MKKAVILAYILLGACAPKEPVIYKKTVNNPIVECPVVTPPNITVTCFNKHGVIVESYFGLVSGEVFETKKGNCILNIE